MNLEQGSLFKTMADGRRCAEAEMSGGEDQRSGI